MSGDTTLTVVGNLTADPELRFTPNGVAVSKFTVASTPRSFDKATNSWVDGEALFMSCTVWRQAAENAGESLTKGMKVFVTGKLKARSYEHKDGGKRTVFELEVESFGPDLTRSSAKVTKNPPAAGTQSPPASNSDSSSTSDSEDETPF
jgi:single-strand DNA-binding protein